MPRGTLQRLLEGRTTTFVLTMAAVLAAGGFWWRRGASLSGAVDPSADTASKAESESRLSGDAPFNPKPFFRDVTAESGLDFVHVTGARGGFRLIEELGPGGAFLDYDNDGDLDVYLVQGGVYGSAVAEHHNRLYRNDGAGHFEDVSVGSGADVPGYGMGCAAADYDNDGNVDLYITRVGPDVLLRNNGDGTFADVTRAAGLGDTGYGAGAAFLDYDRDGYLDLYVTRYVDWSPARERECYDLNGVRDYCNPTIYAAPSHDLLYRSTGDGRFEDVTATAGIGGALGNGLGVLCTDLTGDGWVDVYVANDQSPTFFWVNRGDGTFVEDAALRGCAFNGDGMIIAGMGLAAEDLDADGDVDVLATNIHNDAHLCLRNEGGFFEDVSVAWGVGDWGVPYTGFGVAIFDQDHDGALDCFVANGAVNRLPERYEPGDAYAEPNQFARGTPPGHSLPGRGRGGRFTDASQAAGLNDMRFGVSRAAVVGDYDNDGDLDVLVTNNGGRVQLLRNENATGFAWSMLDLMPSGGARHAINAGVALEAGGKRFRREVRPQSSYLSSHDPRLHFGLGAATVIDRLTVTWPDRSVETWTDLPVNRHLRLRQGLSPEFEAAGRAD